MNYPQSATVVVQVQQQQRANTDRPQFYIILAAAVIIFTAAIFLTVFLVSKPATKSDVEHARELERRIKELPEEWELKGAIKAETGRVEKLFTELYRRCVKGVDILGEYIEDCHQSLDYLHTNTKG